MEHSGPVNPELGYALRRVTESAALAAFDWIGRGDGMDGGRAALDAMLAALAGVDMDAVVVIGEAGKGEAPQPSRGERLGRPGSTFKADIAMDPVEGTSYLARGQTNALAVLAVAPRGTMMNPAPAFYMEKFVAPAPARGKIDPHWTTGRKLRVLAEALNKDVSQLTIYVLEKPRHRELIEDIIRAGARVALYPAGDVAGALLAAIPGSGIDALMGTGGTPEGVMSACAVRGLGGEFLARIDGREALLGALAAVEAMIVVGAEHGAAVLAQNLGDTRRQRRLARRRIADDSQNDRVLDPLRHFLLPAFSFFYFT